MLNIDLFFYGALRRSEVNNITSGRIFNTARSEKDEQQDKIPYVVITFDGASAEDGDKDEQFAELNRGTVSVLCVGNTREELAELTAQAHAAVRKALDDDIISQHEEWGFDIDFCAPQAGPVEMDVMKPCLYQSITYVCDTEATY